MADVTVVAAEVLPGTDTQYSDGILGGTVTAGQSVYFDSATSTYKAADANASAAAALARGIAMNGGVTGQPVKVATGGSLDPGFTVTVGTIYIVSATAGGIAPATDLATGMYTHVLGLGITAASLKLVNATAGVAVP